MKFAHMLATLERLDPWLQRLGVDPKNDRIHNAIDILREADRISRGLQEPPSPERAAKYHFGLSDAIEIHDIFVAFELADPRVLKEKLDRALSGPQNLADETPKNADGRNVMFELSIAAEFKFRGLPVELGDPDIILRLGPEYFVECKRPYRGFSMRSNIRGAADQLEDNLRRNESAYGVIAVSLSRLFNPGDKIFVARVGDSGVRDLGNLLERTARSAEQHRARIQVHPRICAVLFHVSTPAIIESENLMTKMSFVGVFPIGKRTEQQEYLEGVSKDAFRDAIGGIANQ